VRERGVQSRRVRESKEASRRPDPATSGQNVWQIIAIVALLAATAGWTTVAVIALRDPGSSAVVTPTDSTDPEASDEDSAPPVGDSHDAPDLEAALPASVNGVDLQLQSVTGDQLMGDDPWSTTVTAFLTSVGKTPPDLKWAQAYDPNDSLNGSFEAYQLADADPAKLQETLIAAWKTDYPDLKLSDVTIGDQKMVRIDVNVEEQASSSFLFVRNGILYNVTTDDQELVASAVKGLPAPGASPRPASSASAAPSAPVSAAPTP
jgi:hypothetical protein